MIDLADTAWRWEPLLIQLVEGDVPLCIPVVEAVSGRSVHTFGGRANVEGAVCRGCREPAHLIFSFDLADRSFPIRIEGTGRLFLFYPIQYNFSDIWYRMRGDSSIEIVGQTDVEWSADFPFEGYPKWLPEKRVILGAPRPLRLSAEESRTFEEAYRNQTRDSLSLIEWACGLSQGAPRSTCINPECRRELMSLFAIIPVDDLYGFDLAWPNSNGTFTYEICPRCELIYGTQQA